MKKHIKDKKNSLSVIVPIYNEASLLNKSLIIINDFMSKHFQEYEIIVVESGSTDGSNYLTDKISKKFSKIRVFHQKKRLGFGSALKLGYQKARKDYIWLVTVDLPFPLNSIINTLSFLEKYDCILSYRSSDSRTLIRKTQSLIFNYLARVILKLPFKHINSAFKIFKKDVIKKMHLSSDDWLIEAEILYRIKEQGLSYIEIPVPLIDRTAGKSKISFFSSLNMAKNILTFSKRLSN